MKFRFYYKLILLFSLTSSVTQAQVNTTLVGRWAGGPPYAFTVENNIVYTANGGILQNVDISDPSNPILLGQVPTNGIISDIAKEDNYVYLAEEDSGLKVIDVSNTSNPLQVSEMLLTGPVNKLIVSNQTLYIAEGGYDGSQWIGGLRTLDISDPLNPMPLGFYNSSRKPYFISLVGDYIYMSQSSVETLIIDISDLSNLTLAGSFNTRLGNTFLLGNLLFIGMKIFDVMNPLNPILIGEAVFQGVAEDVTVSGNYAFITNGNYYDGYAWRVGKKIRVFNITDPANPTEIGLYESPGNVAMISIMNNVLIISEGVYPDVSTSEEGSGLRIIDVTNPALPEPVGFYETPGISMDVVVRNNYAFVLSLYGGISVVDIEDIFNPTQIGYYNSPGSPNHLVLQDNYAYLADGLRGLRVVEITDLTNPIEVGNFETGDLFTELDVQDDYAYVLFDGAMHILDVSNPSNISEVSFFEFQFTPLAVLVNGNYAYLGDGVKDWHWGGAGGWIKIVDIAIPSNPVLVGEYYDIGGSMDPVFYPTDLALQGNYLYVANEVGSLRVFDVSDPTNPVVISNTSTFGDEIEIYQNYTFISKSYVGMNIFDISDPLNPELIETFNQFRRINGLSLNNQGKIFTASVEYGMLIFKNDLVTKVDDENEVTPTQFSLNQNYPNPFNPITKISYSIPSNGFVTLKIYDILGREIALLVDKEQTVGFYSVEFNANNFPSGIYIYVLKSGKQISSKKMVLLK